MKRVPLDNNWPESWKLSHWYDEREIHGDLSQRGYTYAYENRFRHTLDLLSAVLPAGGTVLDLAAAQGNFTLALAERGYRVTWNDLRDELIDYVKLKHERGEVTYAPGNVFELGFDSCFDAVVMTEIIEHVAHPDEFLSKVARFVKPGGHIVMTTPNGGFFRNTLPRFSDCADPSQYEAVQFKPNSDGHIFLLHEDEVYSLAEAAGLRIVEIRFFTNPLTNGHMGTGKLLNVLPRGAVNAIESATYRLGAPARLGINKHMAVLLQRPAG